MVSAQGAIRSREVRPLAIIPDNRLMRMQVPAGREAEFVTSLQARDDVEYAMLNYLVYPQIDPNDPNYSLQWHLNNTGLYGGTPGADIDAPKAWNIHTGSGNVTIAVIDSGVDLDHPDLAAKIVGGYNFISPGLPPNDDFGHGTHVAGIAAAIGNNNTGVAGVSWGAKLMPLKIFNASGGGATITILSQAIKDAADNGAKVINMSLGGGCGSGWPVVEDAIDYARSKGALLVAAAGNYNSSSILCPAALDGVIAVGATTDSDERASYSHYGPQLDVVAPGSGIYSTAYTGGYVFMSGTSMSTPQVAGLAALIWSVDPTLTHDQVQEIIQTTADDLIPISGQGDSCADANPTYSGATGWDPCFGHGRINAYQALKSQVENIELLETTGEPLSVPVTFIADPQTDPIPASKTIQVVTTSPNVITWTATLSPSVSWVDVSPPMSGQISTASSGLFDLTATKPVTLGTYTTTLVVTGTTSTGTELEPITNEIHFTYLPELQRYYFPIIFKN